MQNTEIMRGSGSEGDASLKVPGVADDPGLQEAPETPPTLRTPETPPVPAEPPTEPPEAPSDPVDPEALRVPEKPEEPQEPAEGTLDSLMAHAFEEYAEGNALTDETYKAFEEQFKVSRKMVDDFIAANTAQVQVQAEARNKLIVEAGNGDVLALQNAFQWAAQRYTDEQAASLNKLLDHGSDEEARVAVQALLYQYQTSPEARQDNVGVPLMRNRGSAVVPFRSHEEMVEAQRDPRYNKSELYRQEIDERITASLKAGTL